jgi:thiamine biosynthesis lipoprotein
MKPVQGIRSPAAALLLVAVLLPISLGGCSKPLPAQTEFVLGTACSVNLYGQGTRETYRKIFDRLREIENAMSAGLADSDLGRINAAAGLEAVAAGPDTIGTLKRAVYFAELTGGAFDPTVGPLVKLWGIGSGNERIPGEDEIAAALSLVNWRDILIDEEAGTVFLRRPGMELDLGAIAKGYAADEAARIAAGAGIERALIDLGGNILVYGAKKDGSPWRVGIQNPLGGRGAYIGVAEVRDKTLVTSGVYERFFESGGRRYHHILSTRTGYPVDSGLLSVTVISGNSMDADALSTSLFALGYEKGRALAESLENTEAIFIFEDRSVRGAFGHFALTDSDFTQAE